MSAGLRIHHYEARGGTIIACQVSTSNLSEIADWTGGTRHPHTREHPSSVSLPHSNVAAAATDWIVRYPDGRFTVLSDLAFHDRYQRS